MVRLKEWRSTTSTVASVCFNSIVVRLEDIAIRIALCHDHTFQFHSGSIRSSLVRCRLTLFDCFNSKVVRLEVSMRKTRRLYTCTFQFHSGSIRRTASFFSSVTKSKFQFHSGSIRRKCCRLIRSEHRCVSIP